MMELYAVWRRRGGAWMEGRPLEAQADWDGHAAFMMALAAKGVALLAGPLDEAGALIVVAADSADAAVAHFADDPWTLSGLLETERVGRWQLRIGSIG